MKAAVLGSPVSHSLSPAIFSFLSRELGEILAYRAIEVREPEASKFLTDAKKSGEFVGFNVTIPLKGIAFRQMDDLTSEARGIGAINVVHFSNGQSKGHNTDLFGIAETFKKAHFEVKGKNIFVWGAGGAARAVLFHLGKQKASRVVIHNRSPRAELALAFSTLFPETVFELVSNEVPDLAFSAMINTTPVGMKGKENGEGHFDAARDLHFEKNALAFDLIYIPESTEFLKVASSLGLKTVGGLGMLIDQALATWKIWVGSIKHEDEVHQKLKKYLRGILKIRQDDRPIFLTGFMGSGKSTVGKELARILGRSFLETDKLIEEKNGMDIPTLFEKMGEAHFREQEKAVVAESSVSKNSTISLGGGALMDPENRQKVLNSGTLIYLEADEATLNQRIKEQGNQRPLMNGLSDTERAHKISTMLASRKGSYEKANMKVTIGKLDPEQVAFQILTQLGEC